LYEDLIKEITVFKNNNIKTEPIPERVYELCKLVSQGDINEKDARQKLEPKSLNSGSYFGSIREVCVEELNLIKKDGDILSFNGDKKVLKNMDSFRLYCNSKVFLEDNNDFYKIVSCFMDANDNWLSYSTITDTKIRSEVKEKTKIQLVTEPMMLGTRFWMSFLGFGYVQEKDNSYIYFLPNMHTALQDFCTLAEFEKNHEYTVQEFCMKIWPFARVSLNDVHTTRTFNLAISNALRSMHDNKEIALKKNSDSKETWFLSTDPTHEFIDAITHIVFKGVKRG
jgi:hypothetical protein